MVIVKVISGGQTGADRAGLDAAIEADLLIGGYCPKGRVSEDGTVPARYPLVELAQGGYPARTAKNVLESDGTLVVNVGRVSGGTRLTVDIATKLGKPTLIIQLDQAPRLNDVSAWVQLHHIKTLNVAGPRESKFPGIYEQALSFFRQLFAVLGS